jgi:predicted MFS family arabinose efflux permease
MLRRAIGWRVTDVLWSPALVRILLAQLVFGFGWCSFLVYPKFLATQLGVGPSTIGAVGAAGGAASSLAVLLVMRTIDVSRRAVFLQGSLLLTLAALGYTFVERFGPIVYVLQAAVSVSYGMAFNAAMASVTDVVPAARLGQAFGLQSAANLSMNAVSTVAAEFIAQHHGWRWVFITAAVAALLSLCLGLGLPHVVKPSSDAEGSASPPYRALLPVFGTAVSMGAAYVALATFHQPYALSLGQARVSSFFVGFTVAALTMRLGFGTLGDRMGRGRVAVGSLLLYVLVTLSMLQFDASRLWLHGAGFGIAHGIAYPTLIAFATQDAPTRTKGRIIASFSGSFSAGTALGASAFGMLSTAYGYRAIYLVATCGLVLAAVMLARRTGTEQVCAAPE